MRITYYFCIAIISLLLFSCVAKHPQFVKKQEIIYQTDFPMRDLYGIFYNTEDRTEYFYIAEMMDLKKLLFFTIEGKKAMEIPTDSVSNWRTTTGIAIKNLDTIVILMSGTVGKGNDRIIFMDRKGNRLKKIELDDAIQADENNWKYFFYKNSSFEQDILFLRAELIHKTVDSSLLKTKNYDLILRDIIPKTHKAHVLLKYNIQTDQYQYALSNMWRIICSDTNLYIFPPQFTVENNILFVYSAEIGNILYLLNKENFQIKKKIAITSPYTDIGVQPCSLGGRMGYYYQDNTPLHGELINIMYDKYNRYYYVIIRHATEDPLLKDEASFSIQIYDRKFNKLTEQVFDGKEYYRGACLVCSQGLLIGHSSDRKDYNPTEVKYDLFKIEK